MKGRTIVKVLTLVAALSLCAVWFSFRPDSAVAAKGDKPATRLGGGLVFPALVWTRSLPGRIDRVAVATRTGAVVANTKNKVYYFTNTPNAKWTVGQGKKWKLIQDLGINWDGSRVFFQTDDKPKTTSEAKILTAHVYDGDGREQWSRPNPLKCQNAIYSPSGKYVLTGEAVHHGVTCYDENLNFLWKHDIKFWYLTFDPQERYVFDGEGGILYRVTGEQEWDFGARTKINSISDNADFLMTQYFRTFKSSQRMFLIGRNSLKKIEIAGTGGCISPDGLLSAYVNEKGKLVVYRTRELLDAGGPKIRPLFKTAFHKPWVMRISRDNKTLFAMGQDTKVSSVMMLVDLERKKLSWKKAVSPDLRVAIPTEDNKFVVTKPTDSTINKYQCY